MAFASVGTLGSVGSGTANQSSLVLTTSATLEANNLGVLLVSVDNNQTTDGDEGAVSGVVDSAGNTWTKGAEFTNGQGGAQAGATCSVWYKRVTSQLNSGGTITISFTNNTSRDASAATAWEFTVGNTVSLEGTPGVLANDGADPGSLDVTTSNISCLRIRAVASESQSPTFTVTAGGWAAFDQNSGGAGGDATRMSIMGEFKISTGTGDASDPGSSKTTDCASVYIAIKEAGNKTITADAGSYAFTGSVASLLHKWKVAADVGSYAVTGTDATLKHNAKITAGAGSYVVTGTDASVLHKWKVAADAGSYAITGSDAALTLASAALSIAAGAGSYLLTGTDATARKTWLVVPDASSYAITGTDANTLLKRKTTADAGSYTFNGVDATFHKTWVLIADAGSYVITGTDASVLLARKLAAGAGAYALNGIDASVLRGFKTAVGTGAYVVSGTDANLLRTWLLTAGTGSYLLSGSSASPLHGWHVSADGGSYLISGLDVILAHGLGVTRKPLYRRGANTYWKGVH